MAKHKEMQFLYFCKFDFLLYFLKYNDMFLHFSEIICSLIQWEQIFLF